MLSVAPPRKRAQARYRVYVSVTTRGLIFVEDTFTGDVVAGPFNLSQARAWIAEHA